MRFYYSYSVLFLAYLMMVQVREAFSWDYRQIRVKMGREKLASPYEITDTATM